MSPVHFFGKLQAKGLNYAKEKIMGEKQIVQKKMSVDQFAELNAAVTRCLPRDMDLDTAQKWIEDKQRTLATVLRNALMSPEQCEKVVFKAGEKFRVGATIGGVAVGFVAQKFQGIEETYTKIVVPQKAFDFKVTMCLRDIVEYAQNNNIKLTVSTLSGIWKLLKKSNQEDHLMPDHENIFFVKLDGVLCGVQVKKSGGWLIPAFPMYDRLAGWCSCGRVFTGGKSAEPCIIEA